MGDVFNLRNQLFRFSQNEVEETVLPADNKLEVGENDKIKWLNVYGFEHVENLDQIIVSNKFDEFLKVLFREEEQRNKLIDMENSLYLTINVLVYEDGEFENDRIRFFYKDDFIWTIQEHEGDYFEEVRDYIRKNKGIVRKSKADYLLFKLLDAILDNYDQAYDDFQESIKEFGNIIEVKPTPEFMLQLEQLKQKLLLIKNALLNMREVLNQLEKWENEQFNNHYFELLHDQAGLLIEEIDMNLQYQESNLNLIFNLQSHRLNQIMKTLTIFSVIFIPLTFLTGIYGMNFGFMPELEQHYGYFILLGIMLVITLTSLIIIKRKKWF